MVGRKLALAALVALASCASEPQIVTTGATFPPSPAAPVHHGPGVLDAFDAKLFGAFASQPGNFVYSPASLAVALDTVRRGAAGPTARELDVALGRADVSKLAGDLAPAVTMTDGLFVDFGAQVEPSFGATAIDFHDHPDASRIFINHWVAERTRDRVRDLLGAGLVRRDTRMIVVSTIHLKAPWQTPFPRGSTAPAAFHLASDAIENVPTMHGRVAATLGAHGGARVLDMPYVPSRSGAALALTILLPERDLAGVEADYRREGIGPFADSATRPGRIDVALPRFSVRSSGPVDEALRAAGVRLAFTDQADFSGISRTEPLKLSAVVQQAFAEVDESGTEAAAASSGGTVEITSARIEEPLAFRVDRPFIFVIRDRVTGLVLFSGRVADPR